jgi:diaminopimelate decarboxylase
VRLWAKGAAEAAATGGRRLGAARAMSPATLPGAPFLARRGPKLELEGHSLDALGHEHGTPLYVYSRAAMLQALAGYTRALAGRRHLVCYAMKANPSLAVLQTFAEAGCGFDIVSVGELERVLAVGGDPKKVVFSGVGKRPDEMRRALEVGIKCFNVESLGELQMLSEEARAMNLRAPVALRINPDVDARTHPYISTGLKGNKFGIAHGEALLAYREAARLPGLDVVGIACHIGSQITEVGPYVDALERLLDLVEAIEADNIGIRHLDIGGGLGIAYGDETLPDAGALVGQLLSRLDGRGHGKRELLVEPGRSLVGNAGVLLTEVLVTKQGAHKNFCIVDAAMNDLLRPALYQATMAIVPCVQRAGTPTIYDVVGPVCESGDWLGKDRPLVVRPGDRLAVLSAGAYAMAMSSNYNSRPRAAEVMIDGPEVHVIRVRESVRDLFAREKKIS